MAEGWLSIHDVAEQLRLELSNHQAWEAGIAIANRWESALGVRPVKNLRNKKNGGGSHCFAIYPPTWQPVIAGAILAVHAQAARQGSLFNE